MSDTTSAAELVVFDLDDTLFPEWDFVQTGWAAAAEAITDEVEAPFDLVERMAHYFNAGNRSRTFDAVLADLGRADADVLVPKMIEAYNTHKPSIALFSDADAALTRLRPDYRLAVLSDGPVDKQQTKVDALGIAGRVDHVVLTGRWGRDYWKPHECGYRWLEEVCGLSGAACVYVANDVSKDFVAPNRLGWQTIHVDRPEDLKKNHEVAPGGQPQHIIATMDELESVLR